MKQFPDERMRLVEAARQSIVLGSKSFAAASRLFDPETRERVWLLYAWCRAADDLVDGQEFGKGPIGAANPDAALSVVRRKTEDALSNRSSGMDAFDALGIVSREVRLPDVLPRHVIDGFALDAAGFSPGTEDELYQYCYHVAGAVGVMMAIVMGVSPEDEATLDRACDLGIAFQLANISRDIVDDARAGRCYLPANWLEAEDLTRDTIGAPSAAARLAKIAKRLAVLAERYAESGRAGATALHPRSAWAVLSAAGIYGAIATKVADRGESAWTSRTSTGAPAKLGWIIKAGWQTLLRQRTQPADRTGLWTRPRFTA